MKRPRHLFGRVCPLANKLLVEWQLAKKSLLQRASSDDCRSSVMNERNFEKGRGREGTSDFTFPAENDFIKVGSCIPPDAAANGKRPRCCWAQKQRKAGAEARVCVSMTSLANNSPQLSIAGLAIDPLGLGDKAGGGDSKHPDVHGLCLRRYCAFLNKKLASVARDPVIEPANGFHDKGANIHSSVLCCAGANGCEDALLGVANMKGVLLNHAAACVRIPNADPSRADLWRLDLTPSTQISYGGL